MIVQFKNLNFCYNYIDTIIIFFDLDHRNLRRGEFLVLATGHLISSILLIIRVVA
jgi:hypothetical protein